MTTRAKQHNAHVRAYRRLISRIVARRYDWGLGWALQGATFSELKASAAEALARYEWIDGWQWKQPGTYHSIGGYNEPRVLYKDVPASVLHSIMCDMRR